MPIGGATATDGDGPMAAWTFQLAKAALESDLWVDTKGNYYHLPKDKHPNKGVEYHWSVLSLTGYDLGYRQSLGWDAVSKEVFSWEPDPRLGKNAANLAGLAKIFDGVDSGIATPSARSTTSTRCCRHEAAHAGRARRQRPVADLRQAQAAAQAIPGAVRGLSSPIAHYAVFSALNTLRDDPTLDSFVRDIGLIADKRSARRRTTAARAST